MTQDGKSIAADRHPLMGVYPAKNGRWSYLHCNFPNHRAVALSVLGVDQEDNEAVRKAVSKWDALELEEAIIAAGGAGGMVRSMDEWAQHLTGCRSRLAAPAGDNEDWGQPRRTISRTARGRYQASACSI